MNVAENEVWGELRRAAIGEAEREPVLSSHMYDLVIRHPRLSRSARLPDRRQSCESRVQRRGHVRPHQRHHCAQSGNRHCQPVRPRRGARPRSGMRDGADPVPLLQRLQGTAGISGRACVVDRAPQWRGALSPEPHRRRFCNGYPSGCTDRTRHLHRPRHRYRHRRDHGRGRRCVHPAIGDSGRYREV